jgi:hypothetical protein
MTTLATLSMEQLDRVTGGRRRPRHVGGGIAIDHAPSPREFMGRVNRSNEAQMSAWSKCMDEKRGTLLTADPGRAGSRAICLEHLAK